MPARSGASSSSMNTSTSFGSSWLNSSPSRQSPSRKSPSRNALHNHSGSSSLKDSPSRQMQLEYNLILRRSDQQFNDRLDQAAAERARIVDEELAKAAREHLRIQEGAKLEVQRIILEQEKEKERKEEAQRREVERLRIEKAEREAETQRLRLEAKKKEEELARQAAEHQKQLDEAEAREKAAQQQAAQKQREEAERKAKETAAAQQKAQAPTQPPPAATIAPTTLTAATPSTATTATTAPGASTPDAEELHRKYMELHARMKKFRVEFFNEVKQKTHPLKGPVGDARRAIRQALGQINTKRQTTMSSIKTIREKCFDASMAINGPSIDIRPFLLRPMSFSSDAEAQFPAFLLYLWICFGKFVIAQWKSEAANQDSAVVQEIGLLAASLYADKKYMLHGTVPMVDLLLAKLHRKCPIMFGVRGGNTTTEEGLIRLGLDKLRDDELAYAQLMSGIGAGYASLTLRTFKSTIPVFEMAGYWRAVVNIINTPSDEIYPGHLLVLKGLLREFAKKFLAFYGTAALAVLRRATGNFPDRSPKARPGISTAVELVKVLPDTWKQKEGITI